MSGPWGEPWSNTPNAPQIPPWLYSYEKDNFAGRLVGAIVYGITVVLFFRCIGTLIDPGNAMRKSVKWGLLAHTMALFLFFTTKLMMNLYVEFAEYNDYRDFPGTDELPPGPIGYQLAHFNGITTSAPVMFALNQWLADGLLLYRCYVIFSMNYRVITLPCLLYAAAVVIGIMHIYYNSLPAVYVPPTAATINTAYYSISLSLNILLMLMIITRLVLHRRNLQHAVGTSDGTTKLYTTIIIMLVESYALYAITFLLYIIFWALEASAYTVVSELLDGTQVIAPYLVILRVAQRRALTSEMVTSGFNNVGSIQFRSQGTTDGDGSIPDHGPTSSTKANAEGPEEVCARDENGIETVPL